MYVESRGSVVDVDVMGVIAVECADGKVRPLCGGDEVIAPLAVLVVLIFVRFEFHFQYGWGRRIFDIGASAAKSNLMSGGAEEKGAHGGGNT